MKEKPVTPRLKRTPYITIASELKRAKERQQYLAPGERFGVVDGAFALLPRGRNEGIKYALLAMREEREPGVPAHPELIRFFEHFDNLSEKDRNSKSMDELCEEAGVDVARFLALSLEQAVRHNIDVSRAFAAACMPQVVKATVKRAKGKGGHLDTRFLGEITGLLPVAKGALVQQMFNIGGRAKDGTIIRDEGPGLPAFEVEAIQSCQIMRDGASEPDEEGVE